MLRIKSKKSNKNNKILPFLILGFFIVFKTSIANEPVDIWKKPENQKIENSEKTLLKPKEEKKIDFSKIKTNTIKEIEITENTENKEEENTEVKLAGLYDPQENNLKLDMWANTDGESIKNTFKRINKIQLSKFSEDIFMKTIMTYSYAPKNKLSKDMLYR